MTEILSGICFFFCIDVTALSEKEITSLHFCPTKCCANSGKAAALNT
jgi:hypothetical protein